MTNCDYIKFEIYGKAQGTFWPSGNYPGLSHPPIEIGTHDSFWIEKWQGALIRGFIKDREVIRRRFVRDAYLAELEVVPDDTELFSTYADDTRISCRFLDQEGNLLPYYPGVLKVEHQGDIEIYGPSIFAVQGSMAAFWIRSTAAGRSGTAEVTVTALNTALAPKKVSFELRAR
jgi:beta-galactosidase